jgi:hypothetical protein
MVCLACGHPVEGAFCSRCGMRMPLPPGHPSVSAPRPMRFEPRVHHHVRTLGILWCIYGAYRAVIAVFAALFLMGISSRWAFSPWGPIRILPFLQYNPWLRTAAPFVASMTIFGAVVSLAAGFSLLQLKPWGRALAMVVGILVLIRIPIGTALGIYTLWVLASSASADEYDALTRP